MIFIFVISNIIITMIIIVMFIIILLVVFDSFVINVAIEMNNYDNNANSFC